MAEETVIQIDENPNDGQTVVIDTGQISKGECPDIKDLSEKEQKSPIAWKWALREITKLQKIESDYYNIKDKYAELDKNFEVYKAKSHQNLSSEIASSLMLALGPAFLGLTPSVGNSETDTYTKWIFGIMGVIMLVSSIIIKFKSYKNHEDRN